MKLIMKKAKDEPKMVRLIPPKMGKGEVTAISESYGPSGPCVYIDVEVPGLDSIPVGMSFMAHIKGIVKSREQSESNSGRKKNSCRIEVQEMGIE